MGRVVTFSLYIEKDHDVIERLSLEDNQYQYIRDILKREADFPKDRKIVGRRDATLRGKPNIRMLPHISDPIVLELLKDKDPRAVIVQLIREDLE